jgi:hypothetical protein
MNLPPFYIGQKVVAITGTDRLKKGSTHIVHAIYFKYCCNRWCVSVGIKGEGDKPVCNTHNVTHELPSNDVFHHHSYFRAIEETFQSISLEKVLENETSLIGSN